MAKEPLRIGVMGAGAIGCWVGGRLAAAGADVVLVGRERTKREIEAHGLVCEDLDGSRTTVAPRFELEAKALSDRDVVLCCVKSAATAEVGDELAAVLGRDAIVVSLQNGVRNAEVLRARLRQTVLAGVVEFNVVEKGGGVYRRATEGELLVESSSDRRAVDLERWLTASGIGAESSDAIAALQWAKLVINLNNAVSALSGRPTREIVLTSGYRRILAALMDEALGVLHAAAIQPAKLTAIPMTWVPTLLRLPSPVVRAFSRAQLRIDPEARSSMYADLARGRPTEVDFLNGEIVRLGEKTGVPAALNRRIVELVHAAEEAGKGSPGLSPRALHDALYGVK